MLLLTSTSDLLRVITGTATSTIEVHASYVDLSGTTVTPGRTNTVITTATTTTVVASPASSTQRNVKALYVTNNSSGTTCTVGVIHTDGTNIVELFQVILLPGENLTFNEEGKWTHRDSNGAEYPPAGLGAYNGRSIGFMKSGTAADVAGCWYCTSKDAGFPGAWAAGTPGVNGRNTDGTNSTDNGCIPIANPGTGANFLTELQMTSSVNHTNLFFDCLWVNSGLDVTVTSAQTIASGTLPARDINGTTNGDGCMIALLATTALGNSAANAGITVNYTNSAGTASRTATLAAIAGSQLPTTAVIGTIIWFNLAAGDNGVRSIQGITLTTTLTSGTISLLICRDVATIGTTIANVSSQKVANTPGIRLYNNTCLLHSTLCSATTATFFCGELSVMER